MPTLNTDILDRVPEPKKLTYRGRLLRAIVETIIELKRFPTKRDLQLLSLNRTGFPDSISFETLGEEQEVISSVKDFCMQFNLIEVFDYCSAERINCTVNGIVYLYKGGDYYKIGRSNNVERRDKEIKLQLPFKVELIHTIETSDPSKTENYWHTYFKSKRLNGEWFRLSISDVQLIKSKTYM